MNVLTLKTNTIDGVNGLTLVSSESVGQTHEVRLTPEHPVYVINRYGEEIGWTMATNLVAGDLIADIDGGAAVKVVANALTQTSEKVYNFEVEGNHNYFADVLGLWVHNAGPKIRGRAPENLREALAIEEARADDGRNATCIIENLGFPKGGRKFLFKHGKIRVHFSRNINNIAGDFKIKP